MLGSWRMSAEVQATADKERERLPETEILLRNHDLNILVAEAIKRALHRAAEDAALKPHKKLIENLASEVAPHFNSLEHSSNSALPQGALPNLALRLKQTAEEKDATSKPGKVFSTNSRIASPIQPVSRKSAPPLPGTS
jgi:hypothetical protein